MLRLSVYGGFILNIHYWWSTRYPLYHWMYWNFRV